MKKWLLVSFFALVATVSFAASPTGEDAKAVVEQQSKVIANKLNNNFNLYKNDPNAFNRLIENEVLPFMDFELMSKYVLGSHWQGMSDAQKSRFSTAFRDALVKKYSQGWSDYVEIPIDENSIRILGTPKVNERHQSADVRLQVVGKGGKRAQVAFSLRYKNGQWKMYDVNFENVSLLTSYRNTFNDEINRHGVDALIKQLETGGIK